MASKFLLLSALAQSPVLPLRRRPATSTKRVVSLTEKRPTSYSGRWLVGKENWHRLDTVPLLQRAIPTTLGDVIPRVADSQLGNWCHLAVDVSYGDFANGLDGRRMLFNDASSEFLFLFCLVLDSNLFISHYARFGLRLGFKICECLLVCPSLPISFSELTYILQTDGDILLTCPAASPSGPSAPGALDFEGGQTYATGGANPAEGYPDVSVIGSAGPTSSRRLVCCVDFARLLALPRWD